MPPVRPPDGPPASRTHQLAEDEAATVHRPRIAHAALLSRGFPPRRLGALVLCAGTGGMLKGPALSSSRTGKPTGAAPEPGLLDRLGAGEIDVETYIDRGVSGAKGRDKRPEFDRLCRDAAQAKIDVVAAWSIDRIGRSLHHVANFMAELADQGVALYLHQQGVDGTTSAGKAMLGMAAVFAEFERALIVERIRSGIARVRGKKRLGRPPVHANIEHRIRELRRTGYAKLRIARTLGCGVSTVQRVLAA